MLYIPMGDTFTSGDKSGNVVLPPHKTHLRQFLGSVEGIGPTQVAPIAHSINDDNGDGYFKRDEIERGIKAYLSGPDSAYSVPKPELDRTVEFYMKKIDESKKPYADGIPATYVIKMEPHTRREMIFSRLTS
ncbi:MAG: hypothetical protein ACOYK1_04375 [Vampirovibrionia bacterium]